MSAYDPRPKSGTITGTSGTIAATPGRVLLITGTGAWGNLLSAQTVTLTYNGTPIATEPIASMLALGARIPFSLSGRAAAVASATASVSTSAGTLYDVKITWLEHTAV